MAAYIAFFARRLSGFYIRMSRGAVCALASTVWLVCASPLASGATEVPDATPAQFCLPPLIPCPPPSAGEAEVNVDGTAYPDNPPQRVYGLMQSHNHLFSYQGTGKGPWCGKTFDVDGVAHAMVDCPEHEPWGIPAWFEQLAGGQPPFSPHDTTGWPTFNDWPSPDSPMHNQTYYKGLERAWRAGARVYVDYAQTNRGLCILYAPTRESCDDMSNLRRQLSEAHAFEAFIDAQYGGEGEGWFRIVTDPAQARQVIADGKLAVILGVEASEPFGCNRWLGEPECTTADIDAGLAELYDLGVRTMYLCHKYDNALCGVRFDSDETGVVVNVGNFITTGQFWQAETCTGPHHDNPILVSTTSALLTLIINAAINLGPITLPIYPATPHCNTIGLSELGEYALLSMMQRGMLIDIDHMSAKAAGQALTILEQHEYPGVISSHNWLDTGYMVRLQQLGGMVAGIARNSDTYVDYWRLARQTADPDRLFGFGYGPDLNGLNGALPRAGENPPITYPFTSFDGQATLQRQVWGERAWDFNADGMAHEGLTPDWLESARIEAGDDGAQFVADLANGAEAYLRMWEGAIIY